jgi:uncharacterized membrane protein YbhN (UPF0104 family)
MNRRLLLRLAVSALVIAALFQFVSWRTVGAALRNVPPSLFALVVVGFLVSHVVGTLKWRLVLNAAGARLTVPAALECYSAGIFSNVFLPSIVGGDVLRAILAGKRSGRMEAAVLGGAADRLLDVAALGALAVGGGVLVGFRAPGAMRTLIALAIGLGVVAAVALVPLVVRRPLRKWPKKIRRRVALVLIALRRQRRRPSALVLAFLAACAIQAALTLLNVPIGKALGIEAPLSAWFFAWSLSKVASLLPVSLNGLGVRDAAFTAIFVPLMHGSLDVEGKRGLAVASSLAWQGTLLVSSLVCGLAWAWLRRRSRSPERGEQVQHG